MHDRLQQDYRIALMGLGGRAVVLAESDGISDPRPYLRAAMGNYSGPEQLAKDLAEALSQEERTSFSLWSEWEMEGAKGLEAPIIQPERYPLTFFCVGLLELAADPMPTLNLHGRARHVLDWFEDNADRLERHVTFSPDYAFDKRREFALGALHAAVQRDQVAEDLEIAGWTLSEDKVRAFEDGVNAAAIEASTIERVFKRAGAFLHLRSEATEDTSAQGGLPTQKIRRLVPKAFLAKVPERARTHYAPLEGDQFGRAFADYVINSFCKELDKEPAIAARLTSPADMLRVIENALENFGPEGEKLVLLIGEWSDSIGELSVQPPEGYEPVWEGGWPAEVARYQGHSILFRGDEAVRRLYVVEPKGWGTFVRSEAKKGTDLIVDVEAVSAGRAAQLLSENPDLFPDVPDAESKLRKLQTLMEIQVTARTGFRVSAPSRACRFEKAES